MEEYEMPNFDLPVILSNDVNADEFSKINQKLRECDDLSPVERVIDLQSKGSQTDSSSSDYQSDWHETFLSDNDLQLANLKVMELESNLKKEEIIKNGLLEKVSFKQNKCNVTVKWYFKVLDANLGGKDFNQTNHLINPIYPFNYSHQLQTKIQTSRNTFPRRQCHKMLSYIGKKVNNSLTCLPSSHLIATKCQRMAPYSKPLNIKAPEELFSFSISF